MEEKKQNKRENKRKQKKRKENKRKRKKIKKEEGMEVKGRSKSIRDFWPYGIFLVLDFRTFAFLHFFLKNFKVRFKDFGQFSHFKQEKGY